MPNQKESHAKRASISLTPRFHRRGTPAYPDQSSTIQKRETNPIYPCPSLAHDQNMRNEPNLPSRWRLAGFSSTNYAKRTQSQYGHGMPCPKNTKRTQLPPTPPIYILQSTIYNPLAQFTPTPAWPTIKICETNPIYRPAGVSPAPPPPITQNKPNFTPLPPCHAGRTSVPMHIGEPNFRPAGRNIKG